MGGAILEKEPVLDEPILPGPSPVTNQKGDFIIGKLVYNFDTKKNAISFTLDRLISVVWDNRMMDSRSFY